MLPNPASLATYGGALADYSAPRDSQTDRSAVGTNPAYADVAAMTKTAVRAFVRFQPNGTGEPTLPSTNAGSALWNNGLNAQPTVARSATGKYAVTVPSTVLDEIPANQQGATPGGFAVNLRASFANLELGSTTNSDVRTSIGSNPNVVNVLIFQVGTSTLVDPNDGTIVDIFTL
jgi:hypothetical protein